MGAAGLALISATLLGISLVLTQIGLRYLPPLRGACISVPTTAVIFLLGSPIALDLSGWNGHAALIFFLAGLLLPAAVTLLTFEANRRIGATLTGAFGNLTPVFATLVAIITLGEIPRLGQVLGMLIVMGGAIVLLGVPVGDQARRVPLAAVGLALLAVVIRGGLQPVVKLGMTLWNEPYVATLIAYLASASVLLTTGMLREGGRVLAHPGRGWWIFSLIGLTNGFVLLTQYAALSRGPVTLVASLLACHPVVAMLIGAAVFGRHVLTPRLALGVGVIILGVATLLQT